jgi:hypothetical protein
MLHRFLTTTGIPELRSESASTEADAVPEVELLLPVEKFWEVQEVIKEIRYLKQTGSNPTPLVRKLNRMILPFVITERERLILIGIKA